MFMKNKLGIITIHSVYNYGAMLQAFALSQYFQSKHIPSEIVDYRPYWLCKDYQFYYRDLVLRPRSALWHLKQYFLHRTKFSRFDRFLAEKMPLSATKYHDLESLKAHDYSVLVTGSDQIWNPFITGWDESYLLTFDQNRSFKIAYSSSFGMSIIPDDWSFTVKKALSSFERLGVRETTGKHIIEALLPDKHVSQVLDPVFLLDDDYWRELSCPELIPEFDYILVYALEVNDEIIKYAAALAASEGLKVVAIHPFIENFDFADLSINEAGPREFIALVDNAKFVVTNSFHGTAFSIILDIPFCCIPHSSTGTRMTSLLSTIGVESQEMVLDRQGATVPIFTLNASAKTTLSILINDSKQVLDFD
jgi:hypothetical protein